MSVVLIVAECANICLFYYDLRFIQIETLGAAQCVRAFIILAMFLFGIKKYFESFYSFLSCSHKRNTYKHNVLLTTASKQVTLFKIGKRVKGNSLEVRINNKIIQ